MSGMIDMYGRELLPEFTFGALRFTNADQFPVTEVFSHCKDNELTLRLSANFDSDSPWRGHSMAVFFQFRLPEAAEPFAESLDSYRKDERDKVKLPEKQPFDEAALGLENVSDAWEHECFARDGRDLFHIYRSGDIGLLIRWSSQRGTMLDHPFLSLVQNNLQLLDDSWVDELPTTRQAADTEEDDDDFDEEMELVDHLDLREERVKVRSFIDARIEDYANRENFGPGDPADPVRLITLGFYAEQSGYVALICDTRADAEVDGSWTLFLEDDLNILYVPEWYGVYMAICEEHTVTIIGHDGTEHVIRDNEISDEDLNALFGEMLLDILQELRADGSLAKLPLRDDAYTVLEEFDGRYFWPTYDTRMAEGRLK